jgi:SRSO17 transposase
MVHSVGVARQYCGRLGKPDNCQVAVSFSIANHTASLRIAYQLYLLRRMGGGRRSARSGSCAFERRLSDRAGDRAQAD